MGGTSRKYTKKDARNFSAAYTDPTLLAHEMMRRHNLAVAGIKAFKGEEPTLPTGVTIYSEEGVKLYEKAYKEATEADARRNYEKKQRAEAEKKARLRGKGPKSPPPSPIRVPARVQKPQRKSLAQRRALLKKARVEASKPPAGETGPVKNGARLVNIRGRKILCDSDDEDDRELIAVVAGKQAVRAKEDDAPAKRSIIDVDADDSLSDELLKNKRRRGDFGTVRPESDKENNYEKRIPRTHPKPPGTPTPKPRSVPSAKIASQTVNAVGRPVAMPNKPSEKLRELNEKQQPSKSKILTPNYDRLKDIKITKRKREAQSEEGRAAPAKGSYRRDNTRRPLQGKRLPSLHERFLEVKAEERAKRATERKQRISNGSTSDESSSSSRRRQREDPNKKKQPEDPIYGRRAGIEPLPKPSLAAWFPHMASQTEQQDRSSSDSENTHQQRPSKEADGIQQTPSKKVKIA